ncbi:PucR family transcriptional regulator [Nocardiopsis coralliicola]
MRLGDLVATPRLKLRFLAGRAQADAALRWAITTDLLDPERYLSGGELVLTGMMWHTAPEDSETFAASVARAGSVAVGAGTALGTVPPDLVAACDRHGLPLIEVPAETAFSTVIEAVLADLPRYRTSALARSRDRQRRILADVAAGADLAAVFGEAAELAGVRAWVLSSTGRAIADAGPPLPEQARTALAAAAAGGQPLPAVLRLDAAGPATVLPVDTRASHPIARWLLVVEGDHRAWTEEQREDADELAGIAVLARSREEERALGEARHAEALPALLAGQRPEEAAALLRAGGVGAGADALVVRAAIEPQPEPPDLARRVLSELLAGRAGAVVAGGAVALAVVAAEAGEGAVAAGVLLAALAAGVRALEGGLAGYRLAVGVASAPRRTDDLRPAVEEAGNARRLAAGRSGAAAVASGAELGTHELLLAAVPDEVRTAYRDRLLGPLEAYDREHRSDLAATLDAFLRHSGSWQRCATALHVHVNTLRYRIGRVEDLTGRDLSRLDHRVDLFLALRLRD